MMNCDHAVELLPWLLNGTLDPGERREVLDHLRGCAACRAALAETRAAWEVFDWHPPAADLVAYAAAAGNGAPRPAGAPEPHDLEEHLAACPRCAADLELVRTSRLLADPGEDERIAILPSVPARQDRPARGAAAGEDVAARRAWRRSALAAGLVGVLAATGWLESARHAQDLERRLTAASSGTARPAVPAPRPGAGTSDLGRRAAEAEARLSALAAQNRQLQEQVSALDRTAAELGRRAAQLPPASAATPETRGTPETAAPHIESDAWVSDVAPAEQASRGAGPAPATVIPLSAGAATLLLHTRHRGTYPGYELEVWDAEGHRVGRPVRVLRLPGNQDAFEEFDITLRPGALPAGSYTLHLFGLSAPAGPAGAATGSAGSAAGSARETLETYAIRVS